MGISTPRQQSDIAAASDCLLAGGVVLLPTDTVFGLAASPRHPEAVEKLFRLKRRPSERRLPVMVASVGQIGELGVDVSASAMKLLTSKYVPGALSVAMGFRSESKPGWLAGRDEIAIRIPGDELLLAVLRTTGPLFVTSANAHGRATPAQIAEVLAQLDGTPDFVIHGSTGGGTPSTLVNCRLDPPVIEREGAVSKAAIMEIIS